MRYLPLRCGPTGNQAVLRIRSRRMLQLQGHRCWHRPQRPGSLAAHYESGVPLLSWSICNKNFIGL